MSVVSDKELLYFSPYVMEINSKTNIKKIANQINIYNLVNSKE